MSCLQVTQLHKQLGPQYVIKNVSFTLQPNTATALIGANGAGKTTILSMLAGLLEPTMGTVHMPDVKDRRTAIGFLPQYPKFFSWMTALEYVEMAGSLHGMRKKEATQRAKEVLQFTGLAEHMHKRIETFSGGMKQRLGISQAIVHKPKLLLLDEPVSALDPIGRRDIMSLLTKLQQTTTILYSTHILHDAEQMTDQLLFLKDGELVEQGTLLDVKKKYAAPRIELVFATETEAQQFTSEHIAIATTHGKQVELTIQGGEPTMQQVLAHLASTSFEVERVAYANTTLDDIFMKVAGKHETI